LSLAVDHLDTVRRIDHDKAMRHVVQRRVEAVGDQGNLAAGDHVLVEELAHARRHGPRGQPKGNEEDREDPPIEIQRHKAADDHRQAAGESLQVDRHA
jgi:hypothetical protein